jgi:hypothetical protein
MQFSLHVRRIVAYLRRRREWAGQSFSSDVSAQGGGR